MTAVSTETPISASSAQRRRGAERRIGQLQRQQRAHRNRQDHAQHNDDRELEVVVEREQDHEDDQQASGPMIANWCLAAAETRRTRRPTSCRYPAGSDF